jgi:hypothetical protein
MSAPVPTRESEDRPSLLALIYKYIVQPLIQYFGEFANFSPVIFSLGSLYIALVTLNYPIFLFSLASGEALLVQSVLSGISNYLQTSESVGGEKEKGAPCKSLYEGSISTKFKYLLQNGVGHPFPNSPLYFIAFAAAYCIQSMSLFAEECSQRGPAYSTRPYIAYIMTSLTIILFALYNLIYNCDTVMGITLSIALGLLVGFMVCYQNLLLFGKQGVDMLFIPPLVERTGMDYICVSTN